jgi:phage tail-like protein
MTTLGMNAAFAAGTNLLGIRNDPYMDFNFLVEIEGLLAGGFSEVTGLQIQVDVKEYHEGGRNDYIHQLRGVTRYPQKLTLKHGLTDIESMWSWLQDVVEGKVERKNGSIYLLDRQGLPAMWWDFVKAYPVKWSGPELRANSATVAFESVELVHQGIVKPTASSLLSAARGIGGAVSQLF